MKYRLYIGLILSASLSACLSITSYRHTLKPELFTPENFQNIGIVNAFDTAVLTFNQDKKTDVFSEGAFATLLSIRDALADISNVNSFISEQHIKGSAHFSCTSETYQRINKNQLREGAPAYPYIIVLEAFDLYFDQDVDVVKHDDGSKSRTAYYDLIASACISLYDSTGEEFHKVTVTDIYNNYDKRSVLSGLLAVGPAMGNAKEEALALVGNLGRLYVKKYHPEEIFVNKYIYTHKTFSKGVNALHEKNWHEAIDIFSEKVTDSNPKISGRAAYNLSVAYEALGMLENAEFWYRKAERTLKGNKLPDKIFYN